MKNTVALILCLITLGMGLLPHGLMARPADGYTFSILDVPGSSSTVATGIDVLGRTVGYYVNSGVTHGFLMSGGGVFSTIDFPGAGWTAVYGVNSSGQIVGAYGSNEFSSHHGFLLGGGSFSSFEVPGSTDTVARGINNRGQIVGDYLAPDGMRHGFLLSSGNYSTIEFPGSGAGSASGINDSGQVAGLSGSGPGGRGFLYSAGAYSRIDFPDGNYTEAAGLNNLGDIVGQLGGPRAPFRGFRLSGNSYAPLDFPNDAYSWDARGINDLGQIVGAFTDRDENTHAYRATPVAMRLGPPDTEGVKRISDGFGAEGPAAVPAPRGPEGSTGTQGGRGPAGPRAEAGNKDMSLEAARNALHRASNALDGIVNARRSEKETELVGRGLAAIASAIDDVSAAIAYLGAHSNIATASVTPTVKADLGVPVGERVRPRIQIAINNLNSAFDALGRTPGGPIGGFRDKIHGDIALAVDNIIAAGRTSGGRPARR